MLPLSAGSFALIVPSGLMMFTAHASEFIQSGVFVLKMCLIMAAGLNAALFHALVYRTRRRLGRRGDAQPAAAAVGARLGGGSRSPCGWA